MEGLSAAPHFVYRYRYRDAKSGSWKMARHHMSPQEAERFFSAPGHMHAEEWEAIESTREERRQVPVPKGPPSRLTTNEARAIWERNKSEDMRRVMWELAYLRNTVELARYVAYYLEVAGVEFPFDRRISELLVALTSHPSPAPLEWNSAEVIALKRIERARR